MPYRRRVIYALNPGAMRRSAAGVSKRLLGRTNPRRAAGAGQNRHRSMSRHPSLPATSLRLEANYAPPQGPIQCRHHQGAISTHRRWWAGRMGERWAAADLRSLPRPASGPGVGQRRAGGVVAHASRRHPTSSASTSAVGAQRLSVAGKSGTGGRLSRQMCGCSSFQIGPTVRAIASPTPRCRRGCWGLDLSLSGT